jgi:hypothetical protein
MAKPLLDMSAARVFFDGIFTSPRVAHPEGAAAALLSKDKLLAVDGARWRRRRGGTRNWVAKGSCVRVDARACRLSLVPKGRCLYDGRRRKCVLL